jgi:hypothetical protein
MSISDFRLTRRHLMIMLGATTSMRILPAWAVQAEEIPPQPYFASVKRALEALEKLGAPMGADDARQVAALAQQNDAAAVSAAEEILGRYTLTRIEINADGDATAKIGGAQQTLIEQGWRVFLVRVLNITAVAKKLDIFTQLPRATWPVDAAPVISTGSSRAGVEETLNVTPYVAGRWWKAEVYQDPPMSESLSGTAVEYRVLQIFSRDRGRHALEAYFFTSKDQYAPYRAIFHSRRGLTLAFNCLPSRDVTLNVRDADGRGCMASITIQDKLDRVYPAQAMRLAPDMQFQKNIYRADGETVRLPDGEYAVESTRGPEYLPISQKVVVNNGQGQIEIHLQRWIDPGKWGWYSGDTHVHAGGCAHYEHPTEGVSPETMIRHVRGEGLSIGDVLTWGPSWYYQKQFFTGRAVSPQATLEHPDLQAANNANWQAKPTSEDTESLLRYDVEVSGFPSSHCGHLVLLRLKDQDYPGTKIIQDWPSWNLPILKWVKEQGAIGGYAHCGIGMVVDSTDLPNYEIPPMDGIGTQEAIMDVTHGVCDFLSGTNTQPIAELNAWYHMLNCGFRLGMIGETDWPCITGERVGTGRSYVRLDRRPEDDSGYEAWARGLKEGRLYSGDGRSHFLEFKVNSHRSGEEDLLLKVAGSVSVEALVAAHLESALPKDIQDIKRSFLNGWHLENARIGATRKVPVELIVNGVAVEKTTLLADGTPRSIKFKAQIARSSWVALRIMPSAHMHPVFVTVADRPIRASKRSAQWCRACVDKVWEVKSPFMRESERPAAAEAFDHARKIYDRIISESEIA